jgi:hypothetical protein
MNQELRTYKAIVAKAKLAGAQVQAGKPSKMAKTAK